MNQQTVTSKALGRCIADGIDEIHYGKTAKVDFDYEPETLLETIVEKLQDTEIDILGVAFVNQSVENLDDLSSSFGELRLSDSIEDANGWRDDIHNEVRSTSEDVPDRFVLIYDQSPSRLTSIRDVTDQVSHGDVRTEITELLKEMETYENDVAQSLFSILGGSFGDELELEDVADFAATLTSSGSMEGIQAIYDNLYLLGLFPDNNLETGSIQNRLSTNRRTVERVADEFEDDDLLNITRAVQSDGDIDWAEIEEALLKFQDTGDATHFEGIQLENVLELLDFEPEEEEPEGEENEPEEDDGDDDGQEEGEEGDDGSENEDESDEDEVPTISADSALTDLVFEQGDLDTIESIVDEVREEDTLESDGEQVVSVDINDEETEVRFTVEQEEWKLIDSVISSDDYGALIDTGDQIDGHGELTDADIETKFRFEEPSRLHRLYERASSRSGDDELISTIEEFQDNRAELVDALPGLQFYPLILMIGDQELLETVNDYLHSYENLIDKIREAVQGETDELVVELIILDTLLARVRTSHVESGVEGILSPVHPFQLWKYRQIADAITDGIGDFDFHEQTFLRDTIENPIDPLQALQFSSHDAYQLDGATLPHIGSIGNLPKYGNTIPSDIGNNDQLWDFILNKFLTAEPHAKDNLRTAVSDPLQPSNVVTNFVHRAGFDNSSADIDGFDLELGYLETTRGDILSGKSDDETEHIIDFLKSDRVVPECQVSTFEPRSGDELVEKINSRPHHLTLINTRAREDYRQFEQDAYERIDGLYLQRKYELGLTDELQFNYTEEGDLFNIYSDMASEMESPGIITREESDRLADEQFNQLLGRSIWVCESLPPSNEYSGRDVAELIHEGRQGDRNFAIYSGDDEYFIRVLTDMVSSYGFPGDEVSDLVGNLLSWSRRHGYTGLLALISQETRGTSVPRNPKGHFGTLLALRWLDERDINQPKLMFSIDDRKTRSWLELTSEDDNRADYFVIYPDEELEKLYFDVVEIKTHDDIADQVLDWSNALQVESEGIDTDSEVSDDDLLQGSSLKQAIKTSKVIEQIFSDSDSTIVPPRREALRQQLFYELDEFLDVYEGDKLSLIELFNSAFRPSSDIVEVRPRTVVVDLEERDNESTCYRGRYTEADDDELTWTDPVQADILTAHDVYELMTDG